MYEIHNYDSDGDINYDNYGENTEDNDIKTDSDLE